MEFFQAMKGYTYFLIYDNLELSWPQYKKVKFNLAKSQVGTDKSDVAGGT